MDADMVADIEDNRGGWAEVPPCVSAALLALHASFERLQASACPGGDACRAASSDIERVIQQCDAMEKALHSGGGSSGGGGALPKRRGRSADDRPPRAESAAKPQNARRRSATSSSAAPSVSLGALPAPAASAGPAVPAAPAAPAAAIPPPYLRGGGAPQMLLRHHPLGPPPAGTLAAPSASVSAAAAAAAAAAETAALMDIELPSPPAQRRRSPVSPLHLPGAYLSSTAEGSPSPSRSPSPRFPQATATSAASPHGAAAPAGMFGVASAPPERLSQPVSLTQQAMRTSHGGVERRPDLPPRFMSPPPPMASPTLSCVSGGTDSEVRTIYTHPHSAAAHPPLPTAAVKMQARHPRPVHSGISRYPGQPAALPT